jgi:hypothetical protein
MLRRRCTIGGAGADDDTRLEIGLAGTEVDDADAARASASALRRLSTTAESVRPWAMVERRAVISFPEEWRRARRGGERARAARSAS